MSIKTEVTRVHSPYLGRHFWVATADLADGRATRLPFYTRDGRNGRTPPLADYGAALADYGGAAGGLWCRR